MTAEQRDSGTATVTLDKGTLLALQRTRFASERTLMAWIRTALSLISFGFTIAKFFEYLAESQGRALQGPMGRTWGPGTVGLTLIAMGVLALIFALLNHRREITEIREQGLGGRGVGYGLAFNIAALLAFLGVMAFAVVFAS